MDLESQLTETEDGINEDFEPDDQREDGDSEAFQSASE